MLPDRSVRRETEMGEFNTKYTTVLPIFPLLLYLLWLPVGIFTYTYFYKISVFLCVNRKDPSKEICLTSTESLTVDDGMTHLKSVPPRSRQQVGLLCVDRLEVPLSF